MAELKLAGNDNTELIVLQESSSSQKRNVQATWDSINKVEIMEWIQNQTENQNTK